LRAIATMRRRAIGIGIVPEPRVGSVGNCWVADVDVGRKSGSAHVGSDHSDGVVCRVQRHGYGEGVEGCLGDG
jgi:hypothetical protein